MSIGGAVSHVGVLGAWLIRLGRYCLGVPRRVPPRLTEFLAPFPDSVRVTALQLRSRVLAVMPKAHETISDAVNAVSVAYSDVERGTGVCHIASYSRHVNVGFNEGASMPDPLGLLVGNGTHIRHVTFRKPTEDKADWIEMYVRAGLDAAGLRHTDGDGGTTVRVMEGRKRRPV